MEFRSFKRIACSCVVAALILATLAGCGGKTTVDTTTAGAADTAVAADATTSEQTTAANTTAQDTTAATTTTESTTLADIVEKITTTAAKVTKPGTTKKASTTKVQTTAPLSKVKFEVSPSSVSCKVAGAKVKRAWKVSENGVSATIMKLEYGKPVTVRTATTGATKSGVQPVCNLAVIDASTSHLYCADAIQLTNSHRGYVNDMAKKAGALIAVNNSYHTDHWGENPGYIVDAPIVRLGKLIKKGTIAYTATNFYKDGTVKWETNSPANIQKRLADGLIFCDYDQSTPYVDGVYNPENPVINEVYPSNYTFFAQVSKDKYLIACGEFMHKTDMVEILQTYGAKTIMELNGGNCSFLYVKGIGNVTGAASPHLSKMDKVNSVLTESLYRLGIPRDSGKGDACPAPDFIYFK